MENSTKVITGKVRFSYANVFEPTAMQDGQTPKYNVSIIISKSDTKTVEAIKKAIEAAKEAGKSKIADKNGKIPVNLKTPLRDGDEERPDDPAYENSYFINANSERKPGIVDRDLNPIMSRDDFYSGCYGRASINFYAFNVNSKGIACGLNNLQKLEDGERLAGGSSAEEDFGGDNAVDDLM
jgi:hypothetical protein|nr:MAG: protein of unknown function DUF2815 [Bacteriophage sp.]DAV56195.1 MAG TPA: DNA helix destabilizing protein [Caudoviricetes sp.]UVX54164.1 MAG: protein of unknown function (DUF2815) [Bacteriophage sp.]UVY41272.1 MAG: Protein of unknown function (DUF2815) [Bacteriophage sp.]UVY66774.1 MAG: Protein of unknown function (DUF2815) [Bacteriophage sp.]